MATLPTGANLPNPPPLVGEAPTVLGPLPGSQPQPATPPKRPGWEPYFLAILHSFIQARDPALINDEWMEMVIRQSAKFADRILDHFPSLKGTVTLPTAAKPLPVEK